MEREFKWQIANPADFDRIAESDAVQPLVQSSGTTEMEAIYYDTFDGQLAKVRGGLRRSGVSGHYLPGHLRCLVVGQVDAFGRFLDHFLYHNVTSRKFSAIFLPSVVSIDSGWNCTPKIGKSLCSTAIISPSSVRAVTFRHSGKPSPEAASE